jgi:hypothetical protein
VKRLVVVVASLLPARALACEIEPGPLPVTTSAEIVAPAVEVGWVFGDASGFFAGARATLLHQARTFAAGGRLSLTSVSVAQRDERSWWASAAFVARPSAIQGEYYADRICGGLPLYASRWPAAAIGMSLRGGVERTPTTPTAFASIEEAAALFLGLRVDFPLVSGGHGTSVALFGGLEAPLVIRHAER